MPVLRRLAVALILIACMIFGSCAPSASSGLPAIAPSSGPHSNAGTASSAARLPPADAPPENLYYPEPGAGAMPLLPSFDGGDYFRYYDISGYYLSDFLASDDGLLFHDPTGLYHTNGNDVYRISDRHIASFVGADAEQIYFMQRNGKIAGKNTRLATLMSYNFAAGEFATVMDDIVSATLLNDDRNTLVYGIAEADSDGHSTIALKMKKLDTGFEQTIFTESGLDLTTALPDRAYPYGVYFTENEGRIIARFDYPFPSEIPYRRHISFDLAGSFLADSQEDGVLITNGHIPENHYRDRAIPQPFKLDCGAYTLGVEVALSAEVPWMEATITYTTQKDGVEDYLGETINWGGVVQGQAGYLLLRVQEDGAGEWKVFNGETLKSLVLDGWTYVTPCEIDGEIWLMAQNTNMHLGLFRYMPEMGDDLSVKEMVVVKAAGAQNTGLYGPKVETAGHWIILDTSMQGNLILYNTDTDGYAVLCHEGLGIKQA